MLLCVAGGTGIHYTSLILLWIPEPITMHLTKKTVVVSEKLYLILR